MSLYVYIILSWFLIGCTAYAEEPPILSVHFLGKKHAKLDGTDKLDELDIVSEAIVKDEDFVSFDATKHTFVLTAAAAKRLSNGMWGRSLEVTPGGGRNGTNTIHLIPLKTPFVIKAFGQPVYLGIFQSEAFSMPNDYLPYVIGESEFIEEGRKQPVSFRILPPDDNKRRDPRADKRIVSAVRKLFPKGR